MDIADDADGRVTIFSVDASSQEPPVDAPVARGRGTFDAAIDRLGAWLDAPYAGVAIAVALAAVLVFGLLLLRR